MIDKQNEQIAIYQQDIEVLKEQIRVQRNEQEEEILNIKQSLTQEQKYTLT